MMLLLLLCSGVGASAEYLFGRVSGHSLGRSQILGKIVVTFCERWLEGKKGVLWLIKK